MLCEDLFVVWGVLKDRNESDNVRVLNLHRRQQVPKERLKVLVSLYVFHFDQNIKELVKVGLHDVQLIQ